MSRCQNLETEHNTTPQATKIRDGGFYYTCAAGGQTKAEETADGGLRSYASMTYAASRVCSTRAWPRRPPRCGGHQVDCQALRPEIQPGPRRHGTVLLLSRLREGVGGHGRRRVSRDADGRAHDWRKELLEETCLASAERRFLDQRKRTLDGGGSEPRDGLRPTRSGVLPTLERFVREEETTTWFAVHRLQWSGWRNRSYVTRNARRHFGTSSTPRHVRSPHRGFQRGC